MDKYIYQKFLLNCDYESVQIYDFPHFEGKLEEVLDYHYDYCLFDIGKEIIRKIDVSEIDNQVDTEDDWEKLASMFSDVDKIVLYNYEVISDNPIIKNYREATLKAYLYRLKKNKQNIYLS